MKKFYLRKSIGSWSAGTQVEIVNSFKFEETEWLEVRVIAGDHPIIEVRKDSLVERRDRSR